MDWAMVTTALTCKCAHRPDGLHATATAWSARMWRHELMIRVSSHFLLEVTPWFSPLTLAHLGTKVHLLHLQG